MFSLVFVKNVKNKLKRLGLKDLKKIYNAQDDILEELSEENGIQGEMVNQQTFKNKKIVLSLIHFNIRSLNKNIDNLITFLETY